MLVSNLPKIFEVQCQVSACLWSAVKQIVKTNTRDVSYKVRNFISIFVDLKSYPILLEKEPVTF